MMIQYKRFVTMGSRLFLFSLSVAMVFFFGAGYAYSGLRSSDQRIIRIAYANGYKDALEYVFRSDGDAIDNLKRDHEQLKTHVLYAADAYVTKVSSLNQ